MKILRVTDWEETHEIAESRRIKVLSWVATPNNHDSFGFCTLIKHPNGMAHFGAWNLILQLASKCSIRGLLIYGGNKCPRAHNAKTISDITRGSERVFSECLPRLLEIGWLEEIEITDDELFNLLTQGKPGHAQRSAGRATTTGQTGQDRTRQDRENTHAPARPSPPSELFSNDEIPNVSDHDRWIYEKKNPWAKELISAGAKIGANNWPTWKSLIDVHGLPSVLFCLKGIQATNRWPDAVETALCASRGQASAGDLANKRKITVSQL